MKEKGIDQSERVIENKIEDLLVWQE